MKTLLTLLICFLTFHLVFGQQKIRDWQKEIRQSTKEEVHFENYNLIMESLTDGDYSRARNFAEKAYQDAINSGSRIFQERTAYTLAYCHQQLKDFSNALKFYLEAEKIALDLGFKERLMYIYTQLSILYLDQGELKL